VFQALREKAERGRRGGLGYRIYWNDGLRIDSPSERLRLKVNFLLNADGGYIRAGEDLDRSFPDLVGGHFELRRLRMLTSGRVARHMAFSVQFEFADDQFNIKDIWYSVEDIPFLGTVFVGHLKEPFSLEELTGSQSLTFMERSLPTRALAIGRNAGLMVQNSGLDGRLYWSGGVFLNIGDVKNESDLLDAFNQAAGYNLTARIAGIPWQSAGDDRLVHAGLSYRHLFRNAAGRNDRIRLSSRPESQLTAERLVDTGQFFADGGDSLDLELAMKSGPFSLQGELFQAFTEAAAERDPIFWGAYLYGSFFLTGESRSYDISRATFRGNEPARGLRPRNRGWGAWEVAFRYSYLDLESGRIRGGREENITAGLNIYLHRKVRLMFNYIRAMARARADPHIRREDADIFQTRFQVRF